jgi:hypothetical protein
VNAEQPHDFPMHIDGLDAMFKVSHQQASQRNENGMHSSFVVYETDLELNHCDGRSAAAIDGDFAGTYCGAP